MPNSIDELDSSDKTKMMAKAKKNENNGKNKLHKDNFINKKANRIETKKMEKWLEIKLVRKCERWKCMRKKKNGNHKCEQWRWQIIRMVRESAHNADDTATALVKALSDQNWLKFFGEKLRQNELSTS